MTRFGLRGVAGSGGASESRPVASGSSRRISGGKYARTTAPAAGLGVHMPPGRRNRSTHRSRRSLDGDPGVVGEGYRAVVAPNVDPFAAEGAVRPPFEDLCRAQDVERLRRRRGRRTRRCRCRWARRWRRVYQRARIRPGRRWLHHRGPRPRPSLPRGRPRRSGGARIERSFHPPSAADPRERREGRPEPGGRLVPWRALRSRWSKRTSISSLMRRAPGGEVGPLVSVAVVDACVRAHLGGGVAPDATALDRPERCADPGGNLVEGEVRPVVKDDDHALVGIERSQPAEQGVPFGDGAEWVRWHGRIDARVERDKRIVRRRRSRSRQPFTRMRSNDAWKPSMSRTEPIDATPSATRPGPRPRLR